MEILIKFDVVGLSWKMTWARVFLWSILVVLLM